MSSKCFVPSCDNTVGIAFPEEPEIKKKWLEILGVSDLEPESSSFVCLDHFQEDENEEADGIIGNQLKTTSETSTASKKSSTKSVKEEKNGENTAKETQIFSVDEFSDETAGLSTRTGEICRLCMKEKLKDVKNIFVEEIEDGVHIVFAILACIHPIEISYEDSLPKIICGECLELLRVCFKFRTVCLKNDKIQKALHKQLPPAKKKKRTIENHESDDAHKAVGKKKVKCVEDTTEGENYDELGAITEFLIKKNSPNKISETKHQDSSSTAKVKFKEEPINSMEEELRRVLEGTLSEEQASADNIIIHIQDDDEDSTEESEVLSNLQLPIVIRPANKEDLKNKKSKTEIKSRRTLSQDDEVPKRMYKSLPGMFQGISMSYLHEDEFCLVDNYLFEYRLSKQNVRYMRCLLPSCNARGVQKKIEGSNLYSNDVRVLVAHDHNPPTDAEKKKQMFFYVMKRKMQSDKTLKFKSVYDEVCEKDPEIKELIPLRNVINEICSHQVSYKTKTIKSFDDLYNYIEDDAFYKLQFTNFGAQFYQEKFTAEDNAKAIVFANANTIELMSESDLMYIDASFRIETEESFSYQLVTVLVWADDSYFPIMFALVNYKTQEIYKKIFEFLHDTLAPRLRPDEIVTEYEGNLYYALGEIYVDSSIGGSVFYYTQNLYKKICSFHLTKDLETNNFFRNIYHMLLMLPLLPVNTIVDGFQNIREQAKGLGIEELTKDLFDHVQSEWIEKVTPDLFCVHRLENRINENVIAPFKKLRDYLMLTKGKSQKPTDVVTVIEKLIELESFLHITYSNPNKKAFARDLSSAQKKNVLRAWQFIENHPRINVNNFFSRVLGYIKCMENQLWIWGFYRYDGEVIDELINAANFSIVAGDYLTEYEGQEELEEVIQDEEGEEQEQESGDRIIMEAVIDENGGFVLKPREEAVEQQEPGDNTYVAYE